jgi:hypothetical protein
MPQTFLYFAIPRGLVRPHLWRVALLVGLVLSLSVVTRAQAATTWTVCAGGCDYTSIKAAIATPTTRDGDTLALAAGTYTEAGITVDKSLTLQGEAAATTIVQAATTPNTATDRVFTIARGVTVTILELMIRYGVTPSSWPGGGGLYNQGTLTLIDSIIRSNAASQGGGIENNSYGTLTLIHSTVRGNVATGGGGGLTSFGTLTLINSTVSRNVAQTGAGGGLANVGTLTLINSTVSRNMASASSGGGLVSGYATLTLINSTVSGNSSKAGGGLASYEGPVTLANSTVSGNSATSHGGGLTNAGPLRFTNSIVAQNPHGGDCWFYDGALITSQGYNLDSDGSCQLPAPTDLAGVDPLLGPLQDNGGPTLTHALLPGSPALDAIPWGTNGCGTTLYSDQRWQARPQPAGGACDIGAFEVEVAGQAFGGWVTGLTPRTIVCQNTTTGHSVTLSNPASPWDCEAAGVGVNAGDQVALRVHGWVKTGATDVGGAVVGMAPSSGSCTNLMTGQQMPLQPSAGATAASCVVAGLGMQPGDSIQISVRGVAQ